MKPVVRRNRAATQVNVVSSEIVVVEEADSVFWLESSMQTSVIGEGQSLWGQACYFCYFIIWTAMERWRMEWKAMKGKRWDQVEGESTD